MDVAEFVQDKTLSALFKSKNYTQAVKNIDKKLKKTPKDQSLLAVKAAALLRLAQFAQCEILCNDLVKENSDRDRLTLVYDTLCGLRDHGIEIKNTLGVTLWQNAIKAQNTKTAQVEFMEEWASQALTHKQWSHFSRAAQSLTKAGDSSDPATRTFAFWQVIGNRLASDTESDEKMSEIQFQTALGLLAMAAKNTAAGAEESTSEKLSFKKHQEVRLLWSILRPCADHFKAIELLQGDGVKRILSDEIERLTQIFELRMESTSHGKQNKVSQEGLALLETCMEQKNYSVLDDWHIWRKLTSGCADWVWEESERMSFIAALEQILDKLLTIDQPYKRTLKLAKAALIAESQCTESPTGSETELYEGTDRVVEAYLTYILSVIDRPHCYADVREQVEFMEFEARNDLVTIIRNSVFENDFATSVQEADQLRWLTAETNSLRFDLFALHDICDPESGLESELGMEIMEYQQSNNFCETITSCAGNAIRLYKLSRMHTAHLAETDTDPGDEACLVATEILRVGEGPMSVTTTICCLLQYLLEDSPHNFQARIQLITTLVDANLYSLAWTYYQKMKVKEILHEDLAPIMFGHVAFSQPLPSPSFDAYDAIAEVLRFYQKSTLKLAQLQELALQHSNYSQVVEFETLHQDLHLSKTKRLLLYERRRIARIRDIAYDELDLSIDENQERRQLEIICDTESSPMVPKSSIHGTSRDEYVARLEWLGILDECFDLVYSPTKFNQECAQAAAKTVKSIGETKSDVVTPYLRQFDLAVLSLCNNLVNAVHIYSQSDSSAIGGSSMVSLSKFLETLSVVLGDTHYASASMEFQGDIAAMPTLTLPSTEFFHIAVMQLECCKISRKLHERIKNTKHAKGAVVAKALQFITKATVERSRGIREYALTWRNHIADLVDGSKFVDRWVLGAAAEGSVGYEIDQLMGRQNAKRFCGQQIQSSLEALDGLLNIKI